MLSRAAGFLSTRASASRVSKAAARLTSADSVRAFSGTNACAVGNYGARMLPTSFNLPDPSNQILPHFQLTKIVATIGPTSEQLEPMQEVVKAGMKIMRLNFSHATVEEVELRTKNLALSQDKLTYSGAVEPNQDVRATLLDTRGPEIRTGKLMKDDSGHETITLTKGDQITLQTSDKFRDEGSTEDNLYVNYSKIHLSLSPGMKVLLDDGAVILTVVKVDKVEGSVTCLIENTGDLRSRAGVNLPMAETDLPAMSEKDKEDIKYGLTIDVDYVAASFIQNADGVREIRDYMKSVAAELGWDESRPLPKIISKIESASALKHFDEILTESDGIMVARGDLGVEIPIQQVTNAQKEMVAACNAVGKPVIVATQMLESMAKNPRPTRAEVSDVTNAVYDGADAVMLSGETAKGKYPAIAVSTMNEIILGAERYAKSGGLGAIYVQKQFGGNTCIFEGPTETRAAIAKAAVVASKTCDAKAIIVLAGDDERVASLVAANKPDVPIVVFCPSAKMSRQLILHRGIYPVIGLSGITGKDLETIALKETEQMGYLASGDSAVVVSYDPKSSTTAGCHISIVP